MLESIISRVEKDINSFNDEIALKERAITQDSKSILESIISKVEESLNSPNEDTYPITKLEEFEMEIEKV